MLLFAGLAAALPALAQSTAALQVSPIRLDLPAGRPAAVLTLHNEGSAPLDAQVRAFAWTQTLDEDRLDATRSLIASPPIVRIEPGGEQVVRVLRVGPASSAREETYRLLIDEIPRADAAQGNAIKLQLRYSVPVFVGAPDGRAPALSFALEHVHDADGANVLMLRASNDADVHAQLSRVRLTWPDGRSSVLTDGLLGYALPHAARRWRVPDAPADATTATMSGLVDGEPFTASVSAGPASTR
jgi:fimbrial chaperone protein